MVPTCRTERLPIFSAEEKRYGFSQEATTHFQCRWTLRATTNYQVSERKSAFETELADKPEWERETEYDSALLRQLAVSDHNDDVWDTSERTKRQYFSSLCRA
jgi:hypothetical protein